MFDVPNL